MDSTLPKKMNVLMLLEVLKKHTDAGHTLSLTEIGELVIREYSVKLDRHAVKSNLMNLVDFGYPVLYDETIRRRKNGEEEVICTDWYYEHDITDPELHILINGLLFSKYIPYSQCKALVGKLKGLSSKYFRHRHRLPENQPENRHLLLTVEVLNEAITAGRCVAFSFVTYSPDKEPRFVTDRDGTPHAYKVSPYEIVVAGGRYYLICAHAKGELFHYNLDYIRDIKLLDHERSRPVRDVPGCERGFDLAAYMKEHIHMYSGKSETVTFRAYLRADD